PSPRSRKGKNWRALYPWRLKFDARPDPRRGCGIDGTVATSYPLADRAADAACLPCRRHGSRHREGALRDAGRPQVGGEEVVFLLGKGGGGAGLCAASGARGHRRGDRLVPRRRILPVTLFTLLAGLSLAIWLYLLLFHGGFWRGGLAPPAPLP